MKKYILILMLTVGYSQESLILEMTEWNEDRGIVTEPYLSWEMKILGERQDIVSEWDTSEVVSLFHDDSDSNVLTFYQNFTVINLLALYREYEIENTDTIRAVPFEEGFIIDYGTYRAVFTEMQLEDSGYRYKYRWVIGNTVPLEVEYIYIKQNTFQGFMEFLERKEQ